MGEYLNFNFYFYLKNKNNKNRECFFNYVKINRNSITLEIYTVLSILYKNKFIYYESIISSFILSYLTIYIIFIIAFCSKYCRFMGTMLMIKFPTFIFRIFLKSNKKRNFLIINFYKFINFYKNFLYVLIYPIWDKKITYRYRKNICEMGYDTLICFTKEGLFLNN